MLGVTSKPKIMVKASNLIRMLRSFFRLGGLFFKLYVQGWKSYLHAWICVMFALRSQPHFCYSKTSTEVAELN